METYFWIVVKKKKTTKKLGSSQQNPTQTDIVNCAQVLLLFFSPYKLSFFFISFFFFFFKQPHIKHLHVAYISGSLRCTGCYHEIQTNGWHIDKNVWHKYQVCGIEKTLQCIHVEDMDIEQRLKAMKGKLLHNDHNISNMSLISLQLHINYRGKTIIM